MASTSRVVIVGALVLALQASTAYAQTENGVTVDPASPAGKEYALPIDQARRDAASGGRGREATEGAGSRPTPAFGEGARPDTGTDSAPGAASSAGPRQGPDGKRDSAGPTSSAPTTTSAQRADERKDIDRAMLKASAGDGGASEGSLALLLGGVVVMVVGVAAGLLLRRGRA